MYSDQHARSMTLVIWIAILCITVAGFGIVGGAAESTTSAADTEQAFVVNVTALNTSITEGDVLVAEATITNEGSAVDSQQIHLKNDDNEVVDSIAGPPLTLEPGESENVTLTWETGPGDAMSGEVRVVSNHGQDGREVQVEEGAFLMIENAESTSPVTAGNTLNTTVTVTNADNHTATGNIWITVDGYIVDSTYVAVPPGKNQTVTLAWTTLTEYTGDWPLTVRTMTDQRATDITVREQQSIVNRSEQPSDRSLLLATEREGDGQNQTTENVTSTNETSEDETPGFGVIIALISVVVASGLAAYGRS